MKRVILTLFLAVTSFVGGVVTMSAYQQADTSIVVSATKQAGFDAEAIERLVNIERTKAGLEPLSHSDKLSQSACLKLNYMDTFEYWEHTAPDGTEPWKFMEQVGYKYEDAGENQAYGQPDETSLVSSWMNSVEHRKNILGDYTEQGVCTSRADFMGINDTELSVNHFGTPQ